MKVIYVSVHEILEFDEIKLFTEMGHQVFSLGAYQGSNKGGIIRGEIPDLYQDEKLRSIALQCSKENIHPELIEWADLIIMHHNSKLPTQPDSIHQPWIVNNWPIIKNKRVVWRSIGQSISVIEEELTRYKAQGLQIVRYSPRERMIPNYAGEDAIIRFYKDSEEYKGWTGEEKRVINFTQSLKQRGKHVGYETFMEVTKGFRRKVYGPGNEDLGKLWGGTLSYEDQKKALRENRVYFYYGTAPAPYTLAFVEAWCTGIPIVAAGPNFMKDLYNQDTNEMDDLIQNGVNGFVGSSVDELRKYIDFLMDDKNYEEAKRIGEFGRQAAVSYFGKDRIKEEWRNFLGV